MKFGVLGIGAVGTRVARQLLDVEGIEDLVLFPRAAGGAREALESLGGVSRVARWSPTNASGLDAVVVCTPRGHRSVAEDALELGFHLISVTDGIEEAEGLLDLDERALEKGLTLAVGAGFSPGLSCVLVRHAAQRFELVDEVHVAKFGAGGPACARQHHRALANNAEDWIDGRWIERPGGSGRELCWFPDPIGGRDCYRGALPDSRLLQPAFSGAQRITARVAATRRDRLTSRLPMLRAPHPEGLLGGIRAEVRGRRDGAHVVEVLGALDRPAVAAATTAAVAAIWAVEGRVARRGAAGLAELIDDTVPFLHEMARRGVKAAIFEGSGSDIS